MPKNTLHLGRRPIRLTHKHVDVCKCKYYNVMKKLMKCDPCREEERRKKNELEM